MRKGLSSSVGVTEGPIEKITNNLRGDGGSLTISVELGDSYFRQKKQVGKSIETKACQMCLKTVRLSVARAM